MPYPNWLRIPSLLLLLTLSAPWLSAAPFGEKFEEIKSTATPDELYGFLYALPKGGDLHNHLTGSGLGETWFQLATDKSLNGGREFYTRVKINNCSEQCETPLLYYRTIRETSWKALPSCCQIEYKPMSQLTPSEKGAWLSSVKLDKATEGRDEFFEKTWSRLGHLSRDANLIAELMVENMKLFGAEGVRYIEWQHGPFGRTDPTGAELDPHELSALYQERLSRPDARATGVTVRFLAGVLRFRPQAEEMVAKNYAFLDQHRELWVGINLVGREDNDKGYPLRFLDVFREMRRKYSGIGISIHAGEVDEPNQHVRDTLLLGATRIGHGVNLITDPDALLLIRNGNYLIENSLVSNHLLAYTPDLKQHPFAEYLRIGIPVCLNTDDRGMWDSNMTDEYYAAVTHFNLSWAEIVQIGRHSLEHAFLQPDAKAKLLEEYDADVRAFERECETGDWKARIAQERPAVSGYAQRTFGIQPR
jgi:adenosine deaminase CECR1